MDQSWCARRTFYTLLGSPCGWGQGGETGVRVVCRPGPWPGASPTMPLTWANTYLHIDVGIPTFSEVGGALLHTQADKQP